MKRHLIFLLLSIISSCTWGQYKPDLKGEIGILVWTGNLDKNISILNKDGSVWMNFNFIKERNLVLGEWTEEKQALSQIKHHIKPLEFSLESMRLHLRVLEIENDYYKVELTDEVYKYISIDDNWKLREWGQHIVENVAIIGFESDLIPIYSEPNETSKILNESGRINPQIFPIDLKNDWLKIKYTCGETEYEGWIKWRNGNKISVELYYDM